MAGLPVGLANPATPLREIFKDEIFGMKKGK
jgi:hypothetical protein